MQRIDGHIIDTDLLTPHGWILDAGCRGFSLQASLGSNYKYLCIDPDPTIIATDNVVFETVALSTYDGKIGYCGWSTGEGNYCYKEGQIPVWYAETNIVAKCTTIKSLMEKHSVDIFELAKIDIEGSEFDLLLSIDFPFAKQVCVEFHDCTGSNKYGTHQKYMELLKESWFGKNYQVVDSYEYSEIKGMYEYLFKLK